MADQIDSSLGLPELDVMNDPLYDTNMDAGDDGLADVDTCRICRAEGTDSEPLFHPCKCSGSIKFVHQDCLMEWLSHSQKKHCELCKTAFRFTKLYSPNMPQTLPLRVLARHVIIHTVKNLATWLRLCLVVTVWLGALPYIIRQIWRLLFWFSDGGWPTNYLVSDAVQNSTSLKALELAHELHLASLAGSGTTPVTPLQATQTTSASIAGIMDKVIDFLVPLSQTFNISAADPLAAGLIKTLYYGFGLTEVVIPEGLAANTNALLHNSSLPQMPPSTSLLSEVSFFRNLTRHPAINSLVITIAEGYVITILVLVCFILVFLIREWVVQQQPGINMGAGFNADFGPGGIVREQPAAPEAQQDVALRPPVGEHEHREPIQRPIAHPRRHNNHINGANGRLPPQERPEHRDNEATEMANEQPDDPFTLAGDAFSPTAEIQKVFTEEPRMTEEFLAIWRRADSDPREVLRIIERENKVDQMRYWVNAMKILQNPVPDENGLRVPRFQSPARSQQRESESQNTSPQESLAASGPAFDGPSTDKAPTKEGSDKSSSSSESWTEVSRSIDIRNVENQPESAIRPSSLEDSNFIDKGKSKETDSQDSLGELTINGQQDGALSAWNPSPSNASSNLVSQFDQTRFASTNSRPRATSDGPQIKSTISPLANNNWSFSPLQSEDDSRNQFSFNDESEIPQEKDLKEVFSFQDPSPSFLQASRRASPHGLIDVQDSDRDGQSRNPEAEEGGIDFLAECGPDEPADSIVAEDGSVRDVQHWEEEFNNNAFSESDSEDENEEADEEAHLIQVPFRRPEPREPVAPHPAEPRGMLDAVADFLWGGVGADGGQNEPGPNDEHVVQDLAAEAPFFPVAHGNAFDQEGDFQEQDRDVVDAAIAADPNDPDGIDDAEDLEGIMELIGMRGPIFSLFQNALFSAFLLALTVAFGVWIPYNIGRISLLLVANPGPAFKLPLRLIFGCAALMQDLALSFMGVMSYCLIAMVSFPLNIWSYYSSVTKASYTINGFSLGAAALRLSRGALERIMDGAVKSLIHITDSEIFAFSAASHESLVTIKSLILDTLNTIGSTVIYIFSGDYRLTWTSALNVPLEVITHGWSLVAAFPGFLAKPDSWVISLEFGKRAAPLDMELSIWNGADRFWAALAGYAALCFLGALYVRKGSPFSNGQVGREWEATIIDLLNQAGGVMKVILIISIEMLVFPLYCGLLLDAALLPLFENTTIVSRIHFTFKSPLTSIFVHWFVGTCYMFHFALFVSMCRKIMRKGVLYFIRDPDDPTFHPVRDVLERNVATQLRKILFSALVYGGLVVICLGGVVWGLAFTFKGVLPIHWSSNEPVLEFPIDLLFYNFVMPLAVNFFKPSDGLHAMYSWWFRQCARMLRLTWFMFDERKLDEEGYNVHRTWTDFVRGASGDPTKPVRTKDVDRPFTEDPELKVYFRLDGRYVRAPASDQVRIPKGTRIFLEVDETNNRIDGKWDRPDGVHGRGSDLYKQVYIPPWFRVRICMFIVSIWLFAALTGVCVTIVPLVFGRYMFAKIIPAHLQQNDVYAFSIGIYILGAALYAIVHLGKFLAQLRTTLAIDSTTPQNVLRRITTALSWTGRILWTYSAFIFILPTLFAFIIELYFIVPIHTYFSLEERHTVHFVQTWTLGLLYVKLLTRIILWHEDSRPAQSIRAIIRNGYLNPDARLATRSFIIPFATMLLVALFYPWIVAKIVTETVLRAEPEMHKLVYRYSYPMCLCLLVMGMALYTVLGWAKGWRMRIRDEVYLIGERLHNFGDRKSGGIGGVGSATGMPRRIET